MDSNDLHESRDLDLSIDDNDPATLWSVFTDAAEDAVFEYGGEVALVLAPEAPVAAHDEMGRPCTSLQIRLKPVVPADTAWLLIFAVDNNYEITVVVSMPLHADEDAEFVEVLEPSPYASWVLTEDEEEIYFVTIILTEESIQSADDYSALVDSATEDYCLKELIETLDWALLHDAVDVHINRLAIEEADALLETLGWR